MFPCAAQVTNCNVGLREGHDEESQGQGHRQGRAIASATQVLRMARGSLGATARTGETLCEGRALEQSYPQ